VKKIIQATRTKLTIRLAEKKKKGAQGHEKMNKAAIVEVVGSNLKALKLSGSIQNKQNHSKEPISF
jgi:hypothetical protein